MAKYNRFTDRARRVMLLAKKEAERLQHEYIGTEHILLGLLAEGAGAAAKVLQELGLDVKRVRLEVLQASPGLPPGTSVIGMRRQTEPAQRVIDHAIEEARQLNHNYVGTEHLLLGLLRDDHLAAQVLKIAGLDLARVRSEVIRLIGVGSLAPPATPAVAPSPPAEPAPAAPEMAETVAALDHTIQLLRKLKENAVDAADFERAAALRDQELKLKKVRGILANLR